METGFMVFNMGDYELNHNKRIPFWFFYWIYISLCNALWWLARVTNLGSIEIAYVANLESIEDIKLTLLDLSKFLVRKLTVSI